MEKSSNDLSISEKNKGFNFLSSQLINQRLSDGYYDIDVLGEIDSTNTYLKDLAVKGAKDGKVIIASSQLAGRGRLGRSFHSPADTGLYMSVLVRRAMPAADALRLTTATAVAVMLALKKHCDNVKIKWVNDIYIDDKKVCGILTESAVDLVSGSLEYAVIGIGINVMFPKNGFPKELQNKAGALFKDNSLDVRNEIASDVLSYLKPNILDPSNPEITKLYRANSWLDGMRVQVSMGDLCYPATVVGVDDNLRLLVTKDDGCQISLSSGEVSVLPQKGRA